MKLTNSSLALIAVLAAACGSSGSDGPAGNQPPTITAIADQTIEANKPGPAIGFAVSDEQPGSLTLTAMSENRQVVADSGLALGGTGNQRTITVTPVIDTIGDSFVSIVATDTGGLSASRSFLITVAAEQKSIQQFTRMSFASDADGEPELINAVEFIQDADGDDFADLLAQ